jgi:bifunctional non-homologous end joining protein LigD
MPLAQLQEPFDHPEWLYEVKYDGFRALAYLESGTARLVSRKGNTYKSFPALCEALRACFAVDAAVLDGEIVFLGPDGKPQFYDLMRRRSPQHFYAFDLLWLDGRDLRNLPLFERKRLLQGIVKPPALYVDHVEHRGADFFRAVCDQDLEGVVAKLANGRYTADETTWVKIKNPSYSQAEGRREFFENRRAVGA